MFHYDFKHAFLRNSFTCIALSYKNNDKDCRIVGFFYKVRNAKKIPDYPKKCQQ